MVKSKNKKDSSSSSSSKAPKCTCDNPFTCTCGNRPPRPSKGHKWDPEAQAWGGKGHKQKGASGQTASVSEKAKTTDVGKTQIAMWQRLPSQLLQELCQRQKRPPTNYKSLDVVDKDLYKYCVIVPDPKDPEKDLFFVPAQPVANEEQAREEGALLALLKLTPNLPHERKLPEPYRTTWINAVATAKNTASTKQNNNATKAIPNGTINGAPSFSAPAVAREGPSSSSSSSSTPAGAQASTSLVMATSYSSLAEKRRMQDEKRRNLNARVRHHEAIRMANQNHQVFMSAWMRKQIESLLRGESINWDKIENGDDNDQGAEENGADNGTQLYVEERLHHEGFSRRQARTAFQEVVKQAPAHIKKVLVQDGDDNEEEWDVIYEECLQWLLVHLNEDQLPEGFDPRGRTLDVIGPVRTGAMGDFSVNGTSASSGALSEMLALASRYGLSEKEARHVHELAQKQSQTFEDTLWAMLRRAAGVSLDTVTTCESSDENKEILREELEALEAIFPSECRVSSAESGLKTITLELSEKDLALEVTIREGVYPSVKPEKVWLIGKWKSRQIGSALHVELIRFMAEFLTNGEPMVFELHGYVQSLLASNDLSAQVLLLLFGGETPTSFAPDPKPMVGGNQSINRRETAIDRVPRATYTRRQRERSPFWSNHPTKTPPAKPFPVVPPSMERIRKSLPAAGARDKFLSKLKEADMGGRVLLVTGDTGCGKTTQIPQFILEESPKKVKIVIAQPRRLAATGVACRVAEERGEAKPGVESVGYVVRGDSALSVRSRLVFCTTGVLLRQFQSEAALDCITHIVVDEVHERHLDTDILIGLLKQSLPQYPHLRVILMSATLDADRFAGYWGSNTPRMHIPGRTFPVADYILEDVLSLTGYVPRKSKKGGGFSQGSSNYRRTSPWNDSEKSDDEEQDNGEPEEQDPSKTDIPRSDQQVLSIEELVKRVDETSFDYDLLAQLVKRLVLDKKSTDDGSILVFLSGAPEIDKAMETIRRCTQGLPIMLLPLHGGLQPRDQNRVFRSAETGFTKVILSTNVAETSVTIPDCTIVIDSAREKQSSYDPANRMPLLVEQFACKASLKQRRGRAGRVREGTCYKLISKSTLDKLSDHGEPEIKRCALDQILLSLLFLGVENGAGSFMRTLLDPPSKESLGAASSSLIQIGAAIAGVGENELALTPLGVHLAGVPAPPTVGKMLVMGCILGCRDAALAMAAGMSIGRSPFLRLNVQRKAPRGGEQTLSMEAMKQETIVEERSALFQAVGASDHAFLAAVYMRWNETDTGGGMRKRLCDSLGLSLNSMRDLSQLVHQLDSSLRGLGFVPSPESNRNGKSWRIIRACAVSAMAPSQLVKIVRPAATYHETAEGAREKDGQARELKFFIRTQQSENQSESREERVFIHPSSANFSTGSYSCPWLVYHSMVRTSKPFLRDVTECNAYPLLLFGGDLQVQATNNLVVVDNWVKLSANARIGSLMGGLRRKVDLLLSRKVQDPSFEIANTSEMALIVKLITSDGLGSK